MIISLFLGIGSFLIFLDKFSFIWLVPLVFLAIRFNLMGFYDFSFFNGFMLFDSFSIFILFITVWVFVYLFFCLDCNFSLMFIWLMFTFLMVCFLVDNFILFYVFFEIVFLLIFVFLLSWGKTLERMQASFYMFFYTIVFSLPFLVFLFYCYFSGGRIRFHSLRRVEDGENWLYIFIFLVFVVKLPLYGFHLWLPKAHVEAPVAGSILLAGVLLKLGAYGIYRFFPLVEGLSVKGGTLRLFYYVSLFGGVIVALNCLRQRDIKVVIAYSSVVHIRFMMVGFLSFSDTGLYGAILILVSHGFISPFLFYGLNYIYEIFHSRRIFSLKGLLMVGSVFCLFWFIGRILNMGFPPFMSFFSEVIIVRGFMRVGLIEWGLVLVFFFLCGLYNVYIYGFVSHGGKSFLESLRVDFLFIFLRFIHFLYVIIFPILFIWLISL